MMPTHAFGLIVKPVNKKNTRFLWDETENEKSNENKTRAQKKNKWIQTLLI